MNRRGLVLALGALLIGATPLPPLAPYEVVLYGTVRSIDARARTITIAYAPLDTAPGGIRRMRVRDRALLRDLEPGDAVRAVADTRRRHWVVRALSRMP